MNFFAISEKQETGCIIIDTCNKKMNKNIEKSAGLLKKKTFR